MPPAEQGREDSLDLSSRRLLETNLGDEGTQRYTTSPDALADTLAAADADPNALQVTLDVGHATVNGHDVETFVDRFGDRIEVCHLYDNDGTADQHEPLPEYEEVLDRVPASYAAFEMKSVADVAACVGTERPTALAAPDE